MPPMPSRASGPPRGYGGCRRSAFASSAARLPGSRRHLGPLRKYLLTFPIPIAASWLTNREECGSRDTSVSFSFMPPSFLRLLCSCSATCRPDPYDASNFQV
ncbi:hypothetical protein U9M48_034862 [Paspalum notatum var. saurae]|uniref:Uncharacterized protein n=1 Tax=Paspalum notatum var. saurae TaxID=547442 RepID=A0AAQ3UBT4_PASNO